MKRLGEVLISAEAIRNRVCDLAGEISRDYQGKDLLMVGILKGAFVFMADLVRAISIPVRIDFLGVASYGPGTDPSEEIKVFKDLNQPVAGRDILIVDDIIDTGLTTDYLLRLLTVRSPRSIKVCSLLNKPSRRKVEVKIDYLGFQIPDHFVVGYGMDFNEEYRHLPEVHMITAS
ncbi:MAG: hypoxanthine phosphoribosyltransferase [Nitrospirae bacterium CG_4_9_14_3_um_filter_53_35]|nr:MAG: hypoxanthine phosphoribosyltransferase [Nitrospirae bacterium CG2_30_53_67]PIS36671.1 MAG: hypoxanthine phosphoribosyltransferase [Nitrospirae bacterium CG08_land_8_20_14_0_20_52_24]PIV85453.1 MAG: hypoxanthine phosphoribosyltransferase [Nitrospirae bacterium CG17_big_fil_post_rev_8_21_14_2_50_50_9]PIW84176.1 MAG: hypoxanthine phosphoribosyltransferase [Nitrospirae bacterium CG_4_8_14_3_um_filter_50_41]PIX85112.1 MAG: hypoxanthine phosphoribosyltransferase [Nitrospirae bacterium CG_4_10